MALTPRPPSAEQARDWGLIAGVVDDEAAVPQARAIAEQLAVGPTTGLRRGQPADAYRLGRVV
ncbi:hypothetical protein [Dactylosporangium sp. NPDC051484]|uniref:hypothetical protein n=1 Tax=Dactylosporangium sp. NPDC051484 TaxID=3154942 RepID=UPI00344B5553